MGSVEAMEAGSKDRYFQSEKCDSSKFVPEGIVARVPYKGTLSETVYQLAGGLRSGMGYCGAKDIDALHNAKFTRITSAGVTGEPSPRCDHNQRGSKLFKRIIMQKILIIDFGSQYTQLIARRVRELNVYCEIHPFNKIPALNEDVKGVILSGSPSSVRDEDAPKPDIKAL